MKQAILIITLLSLLILVVGCSAAETQANSKAVSCYKSFLDNSVIDKDRTYHKISIKSSQLNVDEWRIIVRADYPTNAEPKCAQVVIREANCTAIQEAKCGIL